MSSPSAFRSTYLILLLWCAGLAAAAQFAKIAVPFALVQDMFPQGGAALGWALTLISALGAVLGVVAGGLVTRFGCGRLLVAGLVLGGLCSVWQSNLSSLPVLLVSRLIEGASHLAIVVAAPTLIAQLSSDRWRGAAMSLWSTFFGVTFALAAWFGLPFAIAHGLPPLFLAHGLAMIGLAALLWLVLRRRVDATLWGGTHSPVGSVLAQHGRAYLSASISAPGIGWLFYTLTYVSLLTLLPERIPPGIRATVVGLMPLVSIAVSLLVVPPLVNAISAVRTTILGFVLSAVVMALLVAGVPVSVGGVLLFAALGLVQGASFAIIPELNAAMRDRALASGVMAQMGNLGNLLGTPVLLTLLAATNARVSFVAIAGLYLAAAATHAALARRRARP